MHATPDPEKTGIALPSKTSAEVRARVGRGQHSSFVAEAVAHELRRQVLAYALAESEREYGPIPADVQVEADAEFDWALNR